MHDPKRTKKSHHFLVLFMSCIIGNPFLLLTKQTLPNFFLFTPKDPYKVQAMFV